MKRDPQPITPEFCMAATSRIQSFLTGLDRSPDLERVPERYRGFAMRDHERMRTNVHTDPHRERRAAYARCIRCEYRPVVAGAAMTSRPCGLCGEDQMYGSTNTGVLCVACAKHNSLCAQCGGDIDGNHDRTTYPTSSGRAPAERSEMDDGQG